MNELQLEFGNLDTLITDFFLQDDLRQLAIDIGAVLDCPLLILDDTFHVTAHHMPTHFSDLLFQNAVQCGQITYEASAIISQSPALRSGVPDYIRLEDSAYLRRFAPLNSAGVCLGYLICVDINENLPEISQKTWNIIEMLLAKQMFIQASRQNKMFETAEDILINLLDGGFSSEAYFQLQSANTYLSDFHPSAFALINLTAYHSRYLGKRHLKEELRTRFPLSHAFIYKDDIFLFLQKDQKLDLFSSLAEEFHLKIIISDSIHRLFDLPSLYITARNALALMLDERYHESCISTVSQMRTALMLKSTAAHKELISPSLYRIFAYDQEKKTQYCETLYWYLVSCHSLKKTCDALYTHRNTILYRIRKMQEDFGLPLDDPSAHLELLAGISSLLFNIKGPGFFMQP